MSKKKKSSKLTSALLLGAGAVVGAHLGEGLTRGRELHYVHVPIYSEKIAPELENYKIAFITDVHYFNLEKLKSAVSKLNVLEPNLLLLGGDFAPRNRAWETLEILSHVKTTDGIYGVEGNHDSAQNVFEAMMHYGMYPLDNEGVELRPHLHLGGVADFWNRRASVEEALCGSKKDDYTILLCHNPDLTMMQDTTQADVVICGHTHAGEVNFFGQYTPILSPVVSPFIRVSAYGHRFEKGWCKGKNNTPVYVSKGIGSHISFRVFAPPEITIFTLHHQTEKKKDD